MMRRHHQARRRAGLDHARGVLAPRSGIRLCHQAIGRPILGSGNILPGSDLHAQTLPLTANGKVDRGSAAAGPDLNLPMNPTEYFTDAGLRALIPDPHSVRVWPEQRMPSFAEEDLSD
jgi:hypothetical protein